MTTEIKVQTLFPGYRIQPKQVIQPIREKRRWISCPRCIGGSMFPENNHEYACIQCGFHLYSNKVVKKHDSDINKFDITNAQSYVVDFSMEIGKYHAGY